MTGPAGLEPARRGGASVQSGGAARRNSARWAVPGWTCPSCRRLFRRARQAHECSPAMSLAEYVSTGPQHERPIFEAVMAHLETLGPVHVEPVSVGIFLKRVQTFAQLRPKDHWVAMSFSLPRKVEHERIVRKVSSTTGGTTTSRTCEAQRTSTIGFGPGWSRRT